MNYLYVYFIAPCIDLMRVARHETGLFFLLSLLALLAVLNLCKRSATVFAVVSLLGTGLHEVTHWAIGLILLGRPKHASLIPRRTPDGRYQLGYVMFSNARWYNSLFIALAPLLLLPLAADILLWRIHRFTRFSWWEIAWVYLAACMISACIPSREDIRLAQRSWIIEVAIALAVAYKAFMLGYI